MNTTTTLRNLVFDSNNKEEIESAITLLFIRLNELNELQNENHYLGILRNSGRIPIELKVY